MLSRLVNTTTAQVAKSAAFKQTSWQLQVSLVRHTAKRAFSSTQVHTLEQMYNELMS